MFITLEGIDGSGKTFHIPSLVEYLREKGYTVYPTREPSGTLIGDQIRKIVLDLKNAQLNHHAETLLFLAARAQFVEEINELLKSGKKYIVISDRFADSTIAYQGYGHKQDLDVIRALNQYAANNLKPDLTILFNLDPEIGLKRKTELNRIDAYSLEFHRRVHDGYLELAKNEPGRWAIIDASQSRENVQAALRKVILERIHAQEDASPLK